jgi:hypothetical protein
VVVDLRSLDELGREIARRAEHHAGLGEVGVGRVRAAEARDAEVQDLDRAVPGQPDVGRLDVPVDDPHLVREVEPPADVHRHAGLLLDRETVDRHHRLAEVDALDVLHGDVVDALHLADLEDRHDVRVLQAGGGARLALEAGEGVLAGQERGGHGLERDLALEDRVLGQVHLAHGAVAELRLDLELAELAGFQGLL